MSAAAQASAPELATLHGRVVLITGGSRGLGAAIASTLGAAGMRLVLADIAVQRVQDFAAVLAERDIDAIALPLDVSDPAQCAEAVDRVAQRFGRLDALVNNAAVDTTAPVGELSAADWQRIVASNLRAPFMLGNHAVALMAQQRGGHIVNITSTPSRRSAVTAGADPAAPCPLRRLLQAQHAELRPQGIRVTVMQAGNGAAPADARRSAGTHTRQSCDAMQQAQVVRLALQQPARH